MTRRGWVALGVVAVLVLGGAVAVGVARARDRCGSTVTSLSGARSSSPFLDEAGRKQQPDPRRDRTVASLGTAPSPPFGPVLGAVGYDYQQWAQLSGYAQGIGVRTRDNPDFTMLDDRTLRPLWSVQVDTPHSTYDADDRTYLVATLPRSGAPDLVALDARTGRRTWCASLSGPHVGGDDPLATQLLDSGGVVVLGPGSHGRQRVVRLDGQGHPTWTREVQAEKGDFLGLAGEGLLVAGGRPAYELADPHALRGSASRIVALDLGSGRTVWQTPELQDAGSHVVGTDAGRTVVLQRTAADGTEELVTYDEQGAVAWSVLPDLAPPLDATLRSGRVLVRQGNRFAAYDDRTGHELWTRTLPSRPQLLPYGFQLDDQPLLDDEHLLVGTTTGLRELDLRTGAFPATAPLPTDGINTTFWPYGVVVSPGLIGVATNTSAVVMRRG
ncbi:MAG: PQQ-binding-like beta-propeller repeat protein [Marmoricola sp.]|nr:PQQ-binding-like beta-propeller repeat protein [Marmoricola sp.]